MRGLWEAWPQSTMHVDGGTDDVARDVVQSLFLFELCALPRLGGETRCVLAGREVLRYFVPTFILR